MPIKIHGLAPLLQVYDMPESVRFYCDMLGFELVMKSDSYAPGLFHWAMLRLNGAELMLNTAYDEGERPASPDKARVAAHRDTGLFFGCEDLDAAYNELLEKGIDVNPPVIQRYGMKQLYVTDPDGYSLCFQRPV